MQRRRYHPDHVHTMYPSILLHAMYFRCYENYMIEENDNYKVVFIFSLLMFYCYVFVFLNSQMNCFLFPQKFCVVYLVIKRRHKTSISFIFKFGKILLFLQQREFTIKIKTCRKCSVIIPQKNSFHNFSSVMYILLNQYFCCTVFKKHCWVVRHGIYFRLPKIQCIPSKWTNFSALVQLQLAFFAGASYCVCVHTASGKSIKIRPGRPASNAIEGFVDALT